MHSSSCKTLILPHCRISGGAGKYVIQFASLIQDLCDSSVCFAGCNSFSQYGNQISPSSTWKVCSTIGIPIYKGVSPYSFSYCIAISLPKLIYVALIFIFMSRRRSFVKPKTIVLTSSIQSVLTFIFKLFLPDVKIIILIQENALLHGFWGRFQRFALLKADKIVSITDQWNLYAKYHSVNSIIVPNLFSENNSASNSKVLYSNDSPLKYDLLYVGGDSRIKGFPLLIDAISILKPLQSLTIAFAGKYSKKSQQIIGKFANNPLINIQLIGWTDNMDELIKQSSIILLPISAPHFCRPAIEAGFAHKTFIISEFIDNINFASNGYNCLTFEPGNPDDLSCKIIKLINNKSLRDRLSACNHKVAQQYSLKCFQFPPELVECF